MLMSVSVIQDYYTLRWMSENNKFYVTTADYSNIDYQLKTPTSRHSLLVLVKNDSRINIA